MGGFTTEKIIDTEEGKAKPEHLGRNQIFKSNVMNTMELDTRPTLEELDRVSVEPEIDTFNTGNPIRRASASTYAVESKRSSISTFVTATSFQGSIATFHTAETDLRSIKQESTVLRFTHFCGRLISLGLYIC